MPDDPFSQVYEKLWSILEADDEFTDLVKAGNRIKWNSRQPKKRRIQDADTPEFDIMPMNVEDRVNTSTSVILTKNYQFICTTARKDTTEAKGVENISWKLFRIMEQVQNSGGLKLGLSFVINAEYTEGDTTMDNDRANRKKQGWALLGTMSVRMVFNRATQLVAASPDI